MNNYFFKLIGAAITLAAAGYGAYKLYEKYAGAKVAKQNKFRGKLKDVTYNFDDDEYLEDDDVYYFGQSETDDMPSSFTDVIEDKAVSEPVEVEIVKGTAADEDESVLDVIKGKAESVAEDVKDKFDDILGSSAE